MSNHTLEEQRDVLVGARETAAMGWEPTLHLVKHGWTVQVGEVMTESVALTLGRYCARIWHGGVGTEESRPMGDGYSNDALEAMAKAIDDALGDVP